MSILRVACAALVLAVCALPATAAAADYTWVGGQAAYWWTPANWEGGAAPAANETVGKLAFPATCAGGCSSINNVGSISADSISIDGSVQHGVDAQGDPATKTVAVGAGGLEVGGASTEDRAERFARWGLPLTLTAAQTWSLPGPHPSGMRLLQPVTGTAALTISFTGAAQPAERVLAFLNHMDVGAVTVSGVGTLGLGSVFQNTKYSGFLNSTSGNPVSLTGGTVLSSEGVQDEIGPLSVSGGTVRVAQKLAVKGAVSLDGASKLPMRLEGKGGVAGTDFSQLSATGDVNLGGAALALKGSHLGNCPYTSNADTPGSPATLVSTSGTLSGTFKDLPHGAMASITCGSDGSKQVPVRIGYTANAAIATLLYNSTTKLEHTRAAGATGSVKANEPVTLVAIVTQPTGTPAGTVRFDDPYGSVFKGCEARPVTLVGGRYQATCEGAAFATGTAGPTATFRSATFEVGDSKGGPFSLFVDKVLPFITVTASNAAPKAGDVVTYTATVTAEVPGPAVPSAGRTVAFAYWNGLSYVVLPDCAAMPSTATATGITATCTRTISDTKQTQVGAIWDGDANFHRWQGGMGSGYGFVGGIPNFGDPFAPPATDAIADLLSADLVPSGPSARIKSILKNGGFVYEFDTPWLGELKVTWTYRPPTARAARKAKPFVVAKGVAKTTPATKSKQVKVRLTAKGKKLLKRSKKLRLTAQVGFDPAGPAPATKVTKAIKLKR
jgi:hypothetical protein